jgi:hypothetical protein
MYSLNIAECLALPFQVLDRKIYPQGLPFGAWCSAIIASPESRKGGMRYAFPPYGFSLKVKTLVISFLGDNSYR